MLLAATADGAECSYTNRCFLKTTSIDGNVWCIGAGNQTGSDPAGSLTRALVAGPCTEGGRRWRYEGGTLLFKTQWDYVDVALGLTAGGLALISTDECGCPHARAASAGEAATAFVSWRDQCKYREACSWAPMTQVPQRPSIGECVMDDHSWKDSDGWTCYDYATQDPGCEKHSCEVNEGSGAWGQCDACPVACRVCKDNPKNKSCDVCCQDDPKYADVDGWTCKDYKMGDDGCKLNPDSWAQFEYCPVTCDKCQPNPPPPPPASPPSMTMPIGENNALVLVSSEPNVYGGIALTQAPNGGGARVAMTSTGSLFFLDPSSSPGQWQVSASSPGAWASLPVQQTSYPEAMEVRDNARPKAGAARKPNVPKKPSAEELARKSPRGKPPGSRSKRPTLRPPPDPRRFRKRLPF